MVIDFGVKIELWRCEAAVLRLAFKRQKNGPSTQHIEATSFVKRSNAMIKAEDNSYFLAIKC